MLNNIDLTGMILKPNMILSGNKSDKSISSEETAKLTLKCLKENVPSDVPGVAFLSGGQTEIQATENLNLINKYNDTNLIMTFSYGRALQKGALKFWGKNIKDIQGTQEVFNHRANMCTLAAQGRWAAELEKK
jgi:fructose-bisphosphate aldolase class I